MEAHRFAAMLCDIRMPVMTGTRAAAQGAGRRSRPRGHHAHRRRGARGRDLVPQARRRRLPHQAGGPRRAAARAAPGAAPARAGDRAARAGAVADARGRGAHRRAGGADPPAGAALGQRARGAGGRARGEGPAPARPLPARRRPQRPHRRAPRPPRRRRGSRPHRGPSARHREAGAARARARAGRAGGAGDRHEPPARATWRRQLLEPLVLLEGVAEIVRYQHERFDGKGMPEGRRGEEIPLGARIVAVASVYDELAVGERGRQPRSRRPRRSPTCGVWWD